MRTAEILRALANTENELRSERERRIRLEAQNIFMCFSRAGCPRINKRANPYT